MKRRLVGACALACAVSVVFGSVALAAAPEIGRCVEVAAKTGKYTTDVCTKLAKSTKPGNFEWYPGVANEGHAGAKNHFTGSSGTAVLETSGGVKVECKHEVSDGEFTSTKTVGNISVTFTECKENGQRYKCSSNGAKEEEIQTYTLAGELVWEKKAKKVAILLFPQSGSIFAEFVCGPAPSVVRKNSATGGILSSIPADKMESMVEEKFTAKKGVQKPDAYYNASGTKVAAFLEAKIGASIWEKAGQTETNVQTDEEALEVNTTV
jgi:hypothetical protein